MPFSRKKSGPAPNNSRLEFRLGRGDRELIERAAAVSGQSLTDYAVSSLIRLSQEVLERHHVTQMTDRDRDLFLRLLDEDREPNAALVRAAERYKRERQA